MRVSGAGEPESESWSVPSFSLDSDIEAWVAKHAREGAVLRLEALDGAGDPLPAKLWGGSKSVSAPLVVAEVAAPSVVSEPVRPGSAVPPELDTVARVAAADGNVLALMAVGLLRSLATENAALRAEGAHLSAMVRSQAETTAAEARRMVGDLGGLVTRLGDRLAAVHVADAETVADLTAELVKGQAEAGAARTEAAVAAARAQAGGAAPDREPTAAEELMPFVDRFIELQKLKAGDPGATPKSAVEALAVAKARGDMGVFLTWLKGAPEATRGEWRSLFASLMDPAVQLEAAQLFAGAS